MPIFGRGCLARKTMKIAPRTPREKQNQRMTCPSFCSLAIPNSVDAENQLEAIRFMTSGNTVRLDIAGPNPTPNESKHIESQYSEYLAAQAGTRIARGACGSGATIKLETRERKSSSATTLASLHGAHIVFPGNSKISGIFTKLAGG